MPRRSLVAVSMLVLAAALAAMSLAVELPASSAQSSALRSTGDTLSRTLTGKGRIVVTARALPCQGYPSLRIVVDGVLDRTVRIDSRVDTRYWSSRRYGLRAHHVRLVMVDDRRMSSCDRRIVVSRARMRIPMPVAAPGDADRGFTVAVLGDTQSEVLDSANPDYPRTASWLADRAGDQDLRFVAHTGDVSNWGWLAPSQYDVARSAMARLNAAGVPWQAAAGNHDTRAVDVGGSAYADRSDCVRRFGSDQCQTITLLRRTDEFRSGLTSADPTAPAGVWQAGRPENSFSTFRAAGRRWLVLDLELWPRATVVRWATSVVAAHPRSNVIVQTHHYLNARGRVHPTRGYGSTSPAYLESHLVKPYRNVVMVVSGHVGGAVSRVFDYPGHRVVAFLGNEVAGRAVVRLVYVDVRRGVIASRAWTGTAVPRLESARLTLASGFRFR